MPRAAGQCPGAQWSTPIQRRQAGMKSAWFKSRIGVRGSNPEQREGWGKRRVAGEGDWNKTYFL